MEKISTEYAEYLHTLRYNPYSQTIIKNNDFTEWVIRTLSKESYEKIILPIGELNSFDIKKEGFHVKIVEKQIKQIAKENLVKEFYQGKGDRVIWIRFQTPTSFKSEGRYMIYPTVRHIFQSIMKKYDAINDDIEMFDEQTLDEIINSVRIEAYKLNSCYFPMEGVRIPSFMGKIKLFIQGSETICRYVKLLLNYSEYSGIGIKNSMGMGAIQIDRRDKK